MADHDHDNEEEQWQCVSQLGSGGFGIVHVWKHRVTGECYALKKCKFGSEITLTTRHREAWVREVDIMLRLDHPGVVSCVRTPPGLDQGPSDLPTLCMEYCELGDLRKLLNKPESCRGLSQQQVLEILNDVVSALGYLHNRRIIHRDLKPENVVLTQTESRVVYKLIDLGYAKELGVSSLAKSFVGTLQYVAPELFLEKDYTKSVDYWSLGLLCHEIVTGHRPFLPHMSPGQWVDHVANKQYSHVAIVQDLEGEIRYLTNIGHETQLCSPLTRMIEEWLRMLLDWNPNTRGKDDKDNIVVFTKLNEILSMRWISVFSPLMCQTLYFRQDQFPTIRSLQETLSKLNGNKSSSDTVMLLSRDMELRTSDQMTEASVNHRPQLYCYMVEGPQIRKTINIPDLIKVALTDTKKKLQDHHQKKMFIQGYHFVSEQHENMENLAKSLKLLHSFLESKLEQVLKMTENLRPDLTRMEAKYEMFKESSTLDLKRYHQQSEDKDRITSNKMLNSWLKTFEDLENNVVEVTSRVNIVIDTAQEEARNLTAIAADLDDSALDDVEFKSLVEKSLSILEVLRRERPSLRQDATPKAVAQVVFKMLKKRDVTLQTRQKLFSSLSQFVRPVLDLDMAVNLLSADINQTSVAITKSQLRR